MVTLAIDTAEFKRAINRYQRQFNVKMPLVLKQEAKKLVEHIIKLSPPKSRKVGQSGINKDYGKVFVMPSYMSKNFESDDSKLQERFRKYYQKKDLFKIQDAASDMGIYKKIYIGNFSPSQLEKKNGRITGKNKIMPTNESTVNSHKRAKTKSVGLYKSAWATCANILGGKYPAWCKLNAYGRVIDNTDTNNPSVTLVNKSHYASSLSERLNIIARSLKGRTKALETALKVGVLNKAQQAYYGKTG